MKPTDTGKKLTGRKELRDTHIKQQKEIKKEENFCGWSRHNKTVLKERRKK